MKKTALIVYMLGISVLSFAQFAAADSMIPGTMFTMITEGENQLPYHVYVPSNYSPDNPLQPIIIAFNSNGDGTKIGGKMKDGIEKSGWLLVGCDKLRNGTSDSLGVVWEDEVIPDILRNIPHDSLRIYLAGFSGGALRAYELTIRRPEQYAGVIAYGGWLGGYYTYPKLYRRGMAAAQVNGTRDEGANHWTDIDAEVLRKRNCSVKHFSHPGGHTIAPPDVTQRAIDWLQGEWEKKENVEGIAISPGSLKLGKGANHILSAVLAPGYDMEDGLSWISNDPSIATVDETGIVSGISTGEARVIASTNDGEYADTCVISVSIKVSGVSIDRQYMTLSSLGESKELFAVVSPPDATDKSLNWNSSDTTVALVSENGRVTSVGEGRSFVSVKTDDGWFTASCLVTVYIKVNGISLDTTAISLDSIGATYDLTATVLPLDASDKFLWWSSEDASIVRVDDGGTVTAMAPGTTTVKVTSNDGGYFAKCVVSVSRLPSNIKIAGKGQVDLFPNPFAEEIRVILPENHVYNNLQFLDIKGAVLYFEPVSANKSLLILTDNNVVNARPGVYLIKLSGPGSCDVFKIVKTH